MIVRCFGKVFASVFPFGLPTRPQPHPSSCSLAWVTHCPSEADLQETNCTSISRPLFMFSPRLLRTLFQSYLFAVLFGPSRSAPATDQSVRLPPHGRIIVVPKKLEYALAHRYSLTNSCNNQISRSFLETILFCHMGKQGTGESHHLRLPSPGPALASCVRNGSCTGVRALI